MRFGFRIAFSRAMTPVTPLIFWIGMPRAPLIGAAIIGPSTATPRNTTAMPRPTKSRPLSPKSPRSRNATPTSDTMIPITARRGDVLERSMLESRIAAMGGMRAARSAGAIAATTVTIMPSTYDQMNAAAGIAMSLAGMSRPRAPRRALSPAARKMPATKPTVDATSPTSTASNRTEPSTWRCPAPMARSSASSRLRCATTIENVLKMMKEPTSRATTPKISRKVLKNDRLSFRSLWLSAVMSSPLITSTFWVPGSPFSEARMSATTWSCETPGSRLHVDRLELARGTEQARRGVGREGGDRRTEQAVLAAELHDAAEGVVVAARLGDDRDRVAHAVAGVVGAALVDDDLVRSAGAAALHHAEGAQLAVPHEAEADGGRALAVAPERVALLVDDDREPLHLALGGLDAFRVAHGGQQVGADGASAVRRRSPGR